MRTEDRPGPARTSVYVIFDAERKVSGSKAEVVRRQWVGKAIIAHPNDGACTVFATVWDNTPEAEAADTAVGRASFCSGRGRWGAHDGRAGGYGYDKRGAALGSACCDAGGFGRLTKDAAPAAWKKLEGAASGAGVEEWARALESCGYVVIGLL